MCENRKINEDDDFPDIGWAFEIERTQPTQELIIEVPVVEDEIDPITGEKKPKECEGCSA